MSENLLPSPIQPAVDFDRDGVQQGFLRLPYSRDDSAWGSVMIPITVIRNGKGPTALLTGANHGDEYEGPIALFELARSLRAEEINGRVIIVPLSSLPDGTGDGDVLDVSFTALPQETEKRRERIDSLQRRLFGDR